jgi:hypothetical protein
MWPVRLVGRVVLQTSSRSLCSLTESNMLAIFAPGLHQSLEMKAWANEAKFEASGDSQRSVRREKPFLYIYFFLLRCWHGGAELSGTATVLVTSPLALP